MFISGLTIIIISSSSVYVLATLFAPALIQDLQNPDGSLESDSEWWRRVLPDGMESGQLDCWQAQLLSPQKMKRNRPLSQQEIVENLWKAWDGWKTRNATGPAERTREACSWHASNTYSPEPVDMYAMDVDSLTVSHTATVQVSTMDFDTDPASLTSSDSPVDLIELAKPYMPAVDGVNDAFFVLDGHRIPLPVYKDGRCGPAANRFRKVSFSIITK
jgi:hypothetical protein